MHSGRRKNNSVRLMIIRSLRSSDSFNRVTGRGDAPRHACALQRTGKNFEACLFLLTYLLTSFLWIIIIDEVCYMTRWSICHPNIGFKLMSSVTSACEMIAVLSGLCTLAEIFQDLIKSHVEERNFIFFRGMSEVRSILEMSYSKFSWFCIFNYIFIHTSLRFFEQSFIVNLLYF